MSAGQGELGVVRTGAEKALPPRTPSSLRSLTSLSPSGSGDGETRGANVRHIGDPIENAVAAFRCVAQQSAPHGSGHRNAAKGPNMLAIAIHSHKRQQASSGIILRLRRYIDLHAKFERICRNLFRHAASMPALYEYSLLRNKKSARYRLSRGNPLVPCSALCRSAIRTDLGGLVDECFGVRAFFGACGCLRPGNRSGGSRRATGVR